MKSNRNRKFAKDDSFFKGTTPSKSFFSAKEIQHDSLFNNKRRVAYESHLAKLLFEHLSPTMMIPVQKVSSLLISDIKKIMQERNNENSISQRFHKHIIKDFDCKVLFSAETEDQFYQNIIDALSSNSPADFYKQMNFLRVFVKFFWRSGDIFRPELEEMIASHWSTQLDLERIRQDSKYFRQDDKYFKDRKRSDAPAKGQGPNTSTNFGIFSPTTEQEFTSEEKTKFVNQFPIHQPGVLQHTMSIEGSFSATAMLDYDMPVICGPSGMMAMRLTVANQAHLTDEEKQLFYFIAGLNNIAIAAHSFDESFIIARTYLRGDYTSVIPEVIKQNPEFANFWKAIQDLNKEYRDVLRSNPKDTSILTLRSERKL